MSTSKNKSTFKKSEPKPKKEAPKKEAPKKEAPKKETPKRVAPQTLKELKAKFVADRKAFPKRGKELRVEYHKNRRILKAALKK